MQNEQYDPNDPGKLPGSDPPPSEQAESAWADIGRQIERQLRRDVARLIGSGEVDDWGSIKDALVGRAKGQAEALDTTEVGRRVQDVATQVEQQVRTGLAQASGAGPDADWASIGRTLRQRVENVLDPTSPPAPA